MRRTQQMEINRCPSRASGQGSMADIAFLLLIFFLVTTTIDEEIGIQTLLPPANQSEIPITISDRNVLEVLINGADNLMVEKKAVQLTDLGEQVRLFYTNPQRSDEYPAMKLVNNAICNASIAKLKSSDAWGSRSVRDKISAWQMKEDAVALIGPFYELPSTAVISIQNDRGTSYEAYIAVQNELNAGMRKLRDALSLEKFGVPFSELKATDPADQKKNQGNQIGLSATDFGSGARRDLTLMDRFSLFCITQGCAFQKSHQAGRWKFDLKRL